MSDYESEGDFWNNYNLFGKTESRDFFKYFKKTCVGKRSCQVEFDKLEMAQRCNDLIEDEEKALLLVAQCRTNEVDMSVGYDGQTYAKRTVTKDDFTVAVILADIVIVILYIAFYNRLEE
jgi:hypothetical protein